MTDLATALANLFLFLAVLFAGSFVVVYAALSLVRIVAERFVPPAPSGMPVDHPDHPERDEVELTADEEAAFEALRTNWDKA